MKTCSGGWCRVIVAPAAEGGDIDGYIRQDRLWGVYPNEGSNRRHGLGK